MTTNQTSKTIKSFMILFVLLILLLGGCGKMDDVIILGMLEDNEVLRVETQICSDSEAKLYLATMENEYRNVLGMDLLSDASADASVLMGNEETDQIIDASGNATIFYENSDILMAAQESGDALKDSVKELALVRLQNVYCLSQYAADQGLTLTDDENTKIQMAAKSFYTSLTEEELAYFNVTLEDICAYYTRALQAQKGLALLGAKAAASADADIQGAYLSYLDNLVVEYNETAYENLQEPSSNVTTTGFFETFNNYF